MPSRAARWISAMTVRSKRYDSRRPHGRFASADIRPSVRGCVVDLEVVELPSRAVAAEVRGIRVDLGRGQEPGELRRVLLSELLLDAVRPEAGDGAAHVEPRLVDRVAERIPRIPADDEGPGLRHEGAHVPDGATDDDVDPLHRDPAA